MLTNATLETLDLRENPIASGGKELWDEWTQVGRDKAELCGCEGLENISIPNADGLYDCTYLDEVGCNNVWSLSGSSLPWTSDGELAPAFHFIRFYPHGPDGQNYLATQDWFSPLPDDQLPIILAQVRHLANAAGITHNICDVMAVSSPE